MAVEFSFREVRLFAAAITTHGMSEEETRRVVRDASIRVVHLRVRKFGLGDSADYCTVSLPHMLHEQNLIVHVVLESLHMTFIVRDRVRVGD